VTSWRGKQLTIRLRLTSAWQGVALGIEQGQHCALSARLTLSQLSGRALFDDVSLQVNRGDQIKFHSLIH